MPTVIDTGQFAEDSRLTDGGVLYYPSIIEGAFFNYESPRGIDTPVNDAYVLAGIAPYVNDPYVFVNVECFPATTPEQRAITVPKYTRIMELVKSVCTGLVGIYMPRPAWREIARKEIEPSYQTSNTYEKQMAWEEGMTPVFQYCDFLVTSSYWRDFAADPANIEPIYNRTIQLKADANRLISDLPTVWYVHNRKAARDFDNLFQLEAEQGRRMFETVYSQFGEDAIYALWDAPYDNPSVTTYPDWFIEKSIEIAARGNPVTPPSTSTGSTHGDYGSAVITSLYPHAQKTPAEVRDFQLSWARELDGQAIDGSVWEAEGVEVVQSGVSGSTTTARVSGGVNNNTYVLTNTVTTDLGDIYAKALILKVEGPTAFTLPSEPVEPPVVSDPSVMLENGFYILLEDGGRLLLESGDNPSLPPSAPENVVLLESGGR